MLRMVNWFDVKSIRTEYPKIPIAARAGLSASKRDDTRSTQTKMMLTSPSLRTRTHVNMSAPPLATKAQNRHIYQPSIPSKGIMLGKTSEMINKRSKQITHVKFDQFVDVYVNMKESGGCFCYYFKHQYEMWRREEPKQLIERIMRSLSSADADELACRIKPDDYSKISPQTMMVLAGFRWRMVPNEQKEKYHVLRQKLWMRRKAQPPFETLRELMIQSGSSGFNKLVKSFHL
ncbi:hypothetical protein E3P84_00186 [Wallemia ichthyophaga]|nr:hypothetical protein E3P84_00186 [Wallemia ichthyophaga]TIB44362.1 hypothetical protein E3P83_00186 [Wallemia ichthyophaga]